MKPKRYIVWSTSKDLDMTDPAQRKWFIRQVLTRGRAKDVSRLDWKEVERLLPDLDLPSDIMAVWDNYFKYAKRKKRNKPRTGRAS